MAGPGEQEQLPAPAFQRPGAGPALPRDQRGEEPGPVQGHPGLPQKKGAGAYENAGHGLLHGAPLTADLDRADSVGAKLLRFAKDDSYCSSMATSPYNSHNVFAAGVVNPIPTVMMETLAATQPGRAGRRCAPGAGAPARVRP